MSDISPRRVRVLPQRSGPPPDGLTVAVRRASDVGIGLLGLSTHAVSDIAERFLPGSATKGPHDESIVRQVGRAATGIALVSEQRVLAASGALERMSQRAVETARQVPVVRDVLVGIDSSLTRWSERGDAELERRQTVVIEFAARAVPALFDAFFERVDFAAVVHRVPLADIVAAIDLNAVLEQVDLNAVLARVDVDALLERIDADALMGRIDVDALLGRIDVDLLMSRVDIEAMLNRIDLGPVVAEVLTEVDVGGIVRESTGSITNDAVDGARLTAMRLDTFIGRVADRILLRGQHDRSALTGARPDEPTATSAGSRE